MFLLLVWINEEGQNESVEHECVFVSATSKSKLETRMTELEKQLEAIQRNLEQLTKSNENAQKDMRFFETMLLEEYHLLLQLLGKDQNIRIHQSDHDIRE